MDGPVTHFTSRLKLSDTIITAYLKIRSKYSFQLYIIWRVSSDLEGSASTQSLELIPRTPFLQPTHCFTGEKLWYKDMGPKTTSAKRKSNAHDAAFTQITKNDRNILFPLQLPQVEIRKAGDVDLNRTLTRTTTYPVGEPIVGFTSTKQLVEAIQDAIKGTLFKYR